MRNPIYPVCMVILIFSCITNSSCNRPGNGKEHVIDKNSHPQPVANLLDSLLAIALSYDGLRFDNTNPFMVVQAGEYLSDSLKNVIVVRELTDSTYELRVYSKQGNKLKLDDSIEGIDVSEVYFDMSYDDYNFDGQRDIFLRERASNRYEMSYGLLLTIDPATKKITPHPETRELSNMWLEPATRTVFSDSTTSCANTDMTAICHLTNKWVDGKLTTVSRKCACK